VREVVVVAKAPQVHRWLGRAIGLDLHREFCEIAICESGQRYGGGRVKMTAEGIAALAGSLASTDRVVMEVLSSAWEVARRRGAVVSVSWSSARMTPGSRTRARRPTKSTRARCGPVVEG
jgi:hypothetical protein